MKDYKHAVFIGRFQPFHNGHLEVVKHGLKIAEKVIIVVGSIGSSPNVKNPFSFEERKKLIKDAVCPTTVKTVDDGYGNITTITYEDLDSKGRVEIIGVRDYYYNENTWISDVQAKTDAFIQEGESVALLGDYKDESSYYLKYFPQWDFVPVKNTVKLDASMVREYLFNAENVRFNDEEGQINGVPDMETIANMVPDNVLTFLKEFTKTFRYLELIGEQKFLKDYEAKWALAPYAPSFVTTDAVVVCSGHVLLVKRKFSPGKGLFALPGGFVKQDELIQDAAMRELKEETGIRVDKIILNASIIDSHVFDHPSRSLRGRTITHGFYLKLKAGKLPEVRGNDDAASAQWVPLADVFKMEDKFFEDHAHIINYFVNRG